VTVLGSNDDVVDGDVDELNEKSNETHDGKANSCGHSNLLEF
jgi:hypothetical protein